jgi:membrane-associated protein
MGAGYAFGNMPVVKENFELVIVGIVAVSLLPAAYGFISGRLRRTARTVEVAAD